MRNYTKKWVFPELLAVPGSFQASLGVSAVVAQTLFHRGITTLDAANAFLDPAVYKPAPATQLPGIKKATERIQTALTDSEAILVWGDFDVDGQTSTALLVSALRDLGAAVYHYIPNRERESHGISTSSLSSQLDLINPSLLITCDTGIDALEPVNLAKSLGTDIIITDHHQLPSTLPDAYSIINPNLLPLNHPLSSLPGVGVAYKLIENLYLIYDRQVDHLLDLVALGIVADVAHLSGDTRFLLQRGLPILRNTSRLGLLQLFNNAKLLQSEINEDQIGYVIGPRLNALGRLHDANSCVAFFTTDNMGIATELANQLEGYNLQRQQLTESIFQDSLNLIKANPDLVDDYSILVLLGPPDWNPGVVGIVASRLVDRFLKPVIMLATEGTEARGSARSIPGISIADLLTSVSDLLIRYGGHPMAAGMRLPLDKVSQFRRKISQNCIRIFGDSPSTPELRIDAELPFSSISSEYITDFHRLAPFGSGNPKLIFATRGVSILDDKTIGKRQNHRKLTASDSAGTHQDLLFWNSVDVDLPKGPIDIAYSLDMSVYRGSPQIQLTLQDFRQASELPVLIKENIGIELMDYREQKDPLKTLAGLTDKYPESIIWAEFNLPSGFNTYPRGDLQQSPVLIVWTTPPSPTVFLKALKTVSPEVVFLFSEDPMAMDNKLILEAIHGMLLHLHSSQKAYDPPLFAQKIAQTTALIEMGIKWIHYHGDYDLSLLDENNLVQPGRGSPLPDFPRVNQKFSLLLQEIASYRAYYKKADKKYLL